MPLTTTSSTCAPSAATSTRARTSRSAPSASARRAPSPRSRPSPNTLRSPPSNASFPKDAAFPGGILHFAQATGMNQRSISRLEMGNTNPTVRTLDRLAKGFGKRLEIRFV
ncbi:helix-turn-helix transcriptional regulator [Gordonibacter sp.]|uniref:helix-turn-helix transcriptional regulator n=1 Tax=Gordonibacter sp. TaxID=1968902 RepID=UPI003FA55F78